MVVTFVMKSVSFVLGYQSLCIIFVLNVVFEVFFSLFLSVLLGTRMMLLYNKIVIKSVAPSLTVERDGLITLT